MRFFFQVILLMGYQNLTSLKSTNESNKIWVSAIQKSVCIIYTINYIAGNVFFFIKE